jgi:hypothetical protein
MKVREDTVKSSVWNNKDIVALVEPRMNARYCVINILDPNDPHHIACWNKIFYTDEDADQDPGCGGHDAVGATSAIAANLAVSAFITMAEYLKNPSDAFLLPNQVEVDLKRFTMTTRVWSTDTELPAPSA